LNNGQKAVSLLKTNGYGTDITYQYRYIVGSQPFLCSAEE